MYSKELSYSNTQSATFYGRTEAKAVAGIAILMMVWHHLFGFPQWLLPGLSCNSIFGNSADVFVRLTASLGNTCIYIYAFSTGYVIYSQSQLYDTWKKRVTRIFKFLLSYWLVCVAFYIFGMIFNQPLPTLREAFLNSFGIKTGCGSNWINVVFAWYVNYYIVLIAFSSVLYKCFKKDKPLSLILSIIGCCISIIVLAYAQIGYWGSFFASLLGLLTAKYHIFDKITRRLKINSAIALFSYGGGIAVIAIFRFKFLLFMSDLGRTPLVNVTISLVEGIIAFVFIFCFVNMLKTWNSYRLTKSLYFLGELSMYIWFVHSIFFTGTKFLQQYIYFAHEPILILIVALGLVIPCSYGFYKLYGWINRAVLCKVVA